MERRASGASGAGKKMSFSASGIEYIYMAASPPCRAVHMCIKELGLDVDMRHIDMYKKAEHTQSWFVKVRHLSSSHYKYAQQQQQQQKRKT